MAHRGRSCIALGLASFLTVGCSGRIAGEGTSDDGDDDGEVANGGAQAGRGGGVAGGRGGAGGASPVEAHFAPGGVYRLTSSQYTNTLRDLLGEGVPVPQLRADIVGKGFTTIGAGQATVNEEAAETFEKAALDAAAWAFGPGGKLRAQVTCAAAAGPDEACARTFLRGFARKVFRRALESGEDTPYLELWRSASSLEKSGWRGLEMAVAALLQSTKFLFRFEEGEPDPTHVDRLRHGPFAMAARLSYLLWGTMPDDELLAAAEMGTLATREGVTAQAKRLLASPRATRGLMTFLEEKLELPKVELMAKDAATFKSWTSTLPRSMRLETQKVVEDLVFDQKGDFLDLIDTRTTFVNRELAAVYEIPNVTSDDHQKVTIPSDWVRVGLLGHGSFLASKSHVVKTSPTQRGKFVVERLLCVEIPPPDPNVNTNLGEKQGATLREILEEHRTNPACASCHKIMDPIGVAFENFDGLGAYRDLDNGKPVDPSGEFEGTTYKNLPELTQLLKKSASVADCVVHDFYRYATAHAETGGEEPVLEALAMAFERSGRRVSALAEALVTHDAFRFAAKP